MILSAFQVTGRGLGNGNAAVLAARAADGDRKLRLTLRDIARHNRIEQLCPSLPKLLRLWDGSRTKSETFLFETGHQVRISGS